MSTKYTLKWWQPIQYEPGSTTYLTFDNLGDWYVHMASLVAQQAATATPPQYGELFGVDEVLNKMFPAPPGIGMAMFAAPAAKAPATNAPAAKAPPAIVPPATAPSAPPGVGVQLSATPPATTPPLTAPPTTAPPTTAAPAEAQAPATTPLPAQETPPTPMSDEPQIVWAQWMRCSDGGRCCLVFPTLDAWHEHLRLHAADMPVNPPYRTKMQMPPKFVMRYGVDKNGLTFFAGTAGVLQQEDRVLAYELSDPTPPTPYGALARDDDPFWNLIKHAR